MTTKFINPWAENPWAVDGEYAKKVLATPSVEDKNGKVSELPSGGIHLIYNNKDIAAKYKDVYFEDTFKISVEERAITRLFYHSYKKAEGYLRKSPKAAKVLDFLENQEKAIRIHYSEGIGGSYTGIDIGTSWNPWLWVVMDNKGLHCPAMILLHELYHQYNDLFPSETAEGKTLWQEQQATKQNDSFSNKDEYLTTVFVNEVIEEGSFEDGIRTTYKQYGTFRIWAVSKKIVTSTFDSITDKKTVKRAYYIEQRFIGIKPECTAFRWHFEDEQNGSKRCVTLPEELIRIGL